MKKFYLSILLLSLIFNVKAQQWVWGQHMPGSSGGHIAEDVLGNKYVAIGITSHPDTSVVYKLDPGGNQIWSKTFSCVIRDLKIKGDLLCFCGYFETSATFESITLNTTGSLDGFVASYTLSGALNWVKQATGPGDAYVNSLAANNSGNISVLSVNDTITQFGSSFSKGISVCTFTNSGSLLSSFQIHQQFVSFGYGEIEIDTANNIYLLGVYNDTLMQIDTIALHASDYYYGGYFLAKLTTSGSVYWAKDFYSRFRRNVKNITIALNGSFYLTETNVYGPAYVKKVRADGNFIWEASIGAGLYDSEHSMILDKYENIYLTGDYWYNAIFAGGCNISGNQTCIHVASLDSTGNCRWALTGQAPESSSGLSLAVQPDYLMVLGQSFDNLPIQLGNITINGTYFIAKISLNGTVNIESNNPNQNLSLFPNPTTSSFTLNCQLSTINCQLKIYNYYGQLIHSQIIKQQSTIINLQSQPKGIYVVEAGNERRKIVVD